MKNSNAKVFRCRCGWLTSKVNLFSDSQNYSKQ